MALLMRPAESWSTKEATENDQIVQPVETLWANYQVFYNNDEISLPICGIIKRPKIDSVNILRYHQIFNMHIASPSRLLS